MTKYVESLYVIYNNPFILTPLLTNFYSNIEKNPKNILLAYLVFPMVLNEERRSFLLKSNVNSSIYTFKNRKNLLIGFSQSLDYFRELTVDSIQHAVDNKWIVINEDMSISVLENQENIQGHLKDAFQATVKLNNIFGNVDIVNLYKYLGIKSL